MLLAIALWSPAGVAQGQSAQIRCVITENGAPARGTLEVDQNGREVGGGTCGTVISVPAGQCRVTVRLDGTLDNPSKTTEVEAKVGETKLVSVDFQTGVLEVRIETKGQRGTGIVIVNRGSTRIGTLGSGVAVPLSAGSYQVVVRLGGEERRFTVDLRPGQRRLLRAQF
jgi:hypothetical protein